MAGYKTQHFEAVRRYARALFDVASGTGQEEQIGHELQNLVNDLYASQDFVQFVQNPTYGVEQQKSVMNAILKQFGASNMLSSCLRVLVRNRRLSLLRSIVPAYLELVSRKKGQMSIEVKSADPLTQQQHLSLVASFEKLFNKTVTLNEQIDKTLLAGVVARAGSFMFDNSLKTKLSNLRLAMKGVA